MITIRKLGDALGAEIQGVDPRQPLSPQDMADIHQAFLEHLVLRFRGSPMSAQQLRDFGANFGPLQPHVAKNYRHPEVPEVVIMSNQTEEGEYDPVGATRGVDWHSDGAFEAVPARATLLHAIAIPSYGGLTQFANMYLAYDTMPAALKRKVEGLNATFRLRGRQQQTQGIVSQDDLKRMADVVHPVIRVHPETGKKSVYANPLHTLAIVGRSREDSDALLQELFAWCEQPQFQWTQHWEVGDTIIWENRSAWHAAGTNYPKNEARKFLRTTVSDKPTPGFGLAPVPSETTAASHAS